MTLDKIDNKLLSYVYHNYREPITVIAKKCRISRDQAEYRIQKYESSGLIKKYVSLFNYSALGYKEFAIIYLKITHSEELMNFLQKDPRVISMGKVLTHYSMYINVICKDKFDLNIFLDALLEKYTSLVQEYVVFFVSFVELYALKKFGLNSAERDGDLVGETEKIALSSSDLKILTALEENGRSKIIDLAKKTGMSSEVVIYSLKKFQKNKLLLGSRIQFDMEKLGYYFAILHLNISNLSTIKKKLLAFCKQHNHINACVMGIGPFNCMIQILYNSELDLRNAVRDINSFAQDSIQESRLILIEKETTAKTLPY